MLTLSQKQAIDTIVAQFESLNASGQTSKSFNLVDLSPMDAKTKRIKQLDREEDLHKAAWDDIARNEAYRIFELLQKDLEGRANVEIHEYYDIVYITRFNSSRSEGIRINVSKIRKRYTDECGLDRENIVGMYYTSNVTKNPNFETIEDLCSDPLFTEALRQIIK